MYPHKLCVPNLVAARRSCRKKGGGVKTDTHRQRDAAALYSRWRTVRFFQINQIIGIGLYRDVWIAAIASSRKSLATQTAAICVRFHGRRVRHVYVTMQITFLARKSALIYRRGLRQRVASLTIDCNGVFAIRAYRIKKETYKFVHRTTDGSPKGYRARRNLIFRPFIALLQ